ncbi:glycosyltransferase family 4 protein [Marinimicrococcus flavescens]|uniref:Glycosyltransferase family 4 protein n=1 Tax=Marinimicrococcus flavescens TaxID=3031815 RepID=A0AAP3XRB1_9PROT|nr:glycosyltransferase family 4 protein [Marinimicrococcus flavescens]
MIYVFYSNDPLAQDLGGGAEHFRGLFRALDESGLAYRLVAARLQHDRRHPAVDYVCEGSAFPRFWLASWRWFWRNRHRLRPGDVLHFHRTYAAWPALVLARGKARVVVTYHNVSGRVLAGRLGRLAAPLRALMLVFERQVARAADAILCVSERDRGELAARVARKPFEAALVIPAALDQRLFANPPPPPGPALAGRLLFLGRLSHQKNLPLAVATLEHLAAEGADVTLTIAGDGEDAASLDRLIARSPARRRIFRLGPVPHGEVPALLAAHGILLLTSRYEASPTVVKEALLARRPVVTTDVGDVRAWLEEGTSGFIRAAEPAALAEGVRAARLLLEAGRYRPGAALERLDERAIMGRVLDLYRRLAAA